MTLTDAHCHLQDPRLGPHLHQALTLCRSLGITAWMVNATREADWESVALLAQTEAGVHPSFGLHPWWQKERSPNWAQKLEAILQKYPQSAIGETGLDQWVSGHDICDQREVLRVHLELSRKLNRPITLHCLRAWPDMERAVEKSPPSKRGFLLHAYAGPVERIPFWVERGAYFSFSPSFLHQRKAAARAAFKQVPRERVLVETDAPDMRPPAEKEKIALGGKGEELNHPANLVLCAEALASDLGKPLDRVLAELQENTHRLFYEQE